MFSLLLQFTKFIKSKQCILTLLLLLIFSRSDAQIHYIDFNPDIELSAYPEGNRDTFALDMNEDGVTDFTAAAWSWFQFIHQQCCWNYRAYITGTDTGNAFADSPSACSPLYLDSGSCFGSPNIYNAIMFGQMGPAGLCEPESINPEYYPFKMLIQNQPHYGWLRVGANVGALTIYDGAINLVSGDSMCAGQVVGLNDAPEVLTLHVFPNPARDIITIEAPFPAVGGRLRLLDGFGRILISEQVKSTGPIRLSVDALASGFYFLKLESDRFRAVSTVVLR